MTQSKPTVSALLLVVLFSTTSLLSLILMPALPDIAHFYGIPVSRAAELISAYLMGYALGPMLYPPIADRFGRRWALYVGFGIAILGAGLAIIAVEMVHFQLLLWARVMIAVGASSGLVITLVIISDIHDEKTARKIVSSMLLAFSIVPFISQFIGGYVTEHGGWLWLNHISLAYLIFSFICTWFVAETLENANKKPMALHTLHRRYLPCLRNRSFVGYLLLYTFAGCAVYGFNTIGSILAIQDLHINPVNYGLLCIIPGVGIVAGSLLSRCLASRLNAEHVMCMGMTLLLCASITLWVIIKMRYLNAYTLFGGGIFIVMGALMVNPNASMKAITSSTDRASASAVLNTLGIMGIAFFIKYVTIFAEHSLFTLPISLTGLAVFGLIILGFLSVLPKPRS